MYFEDISLNMEREISPALIDKEKMLAFAREYDNIPLHTDEEFAKNTSFGGLIAPGVMSFMAVWAKYLENDLFADELLAGKSTKIEWYKPVYPGDILTSKLKVTKKEERNVRNGIIEITIYAYNQKGECVLSGITEAIVKRRNKNES